MKDDLRVSDADRDRAASLLQVHFAAGRLTLSELHDRLGAVLAAVTAGDLRQAMDPRCRGLSPSHSMTGGWRTGTGGCSPSTRAGTGGCTARKSWQC
jgi:hypothetical protein